jgi:hypothetical protein
MVNERSTASVIWPIGTVNGEILHEEANGEQGHRGHGEDWNGHD